MAAGIIFSCLLIIHIALLVLGRSWVFTTILFYPAIAICIVSIYRLWKRKKTKTPAYFKSLKYFRYSIYLIFAFLLLLDLGLRYSTKKYQSYSETNYGWFYISPFADGFSELKHKYYYGSDNNELNTHPANIEYLFETCDFKYVHKYNEYGLRERSNLNELLKNKNLILTIGDSFTEGVGTSQDSTWQRILEKKLNDSIDKKYVVVNAGISGFDPIEEYNLMQKLLLDLSPEFVVISIGTNDIIDLIERRSNNIKSSKSYNLISHPLGYYFYAWSYLYRATCTILYDYPEIFLSQKEFDKRANDAANTISSVLENISSIGKEKGFKTIVIFYPTEDELENSKFKLDAFYRIIKKSETHKDVLNVNILEFFNQNKNAFIIPTKILYWVHDGHMTPIGYRIWADILYSDLVIGEFVKKNEQ